MFRKRLAHFLSAAMNAPLIAMISFISLILTQWRAISPLLIAITAIFVGILPLASVVYMAKRGMIPDVYASERGSRIKPFMIAIAFYLIGLIALLIVNAPSSVTAFMASYLVNATVLLAISLIWKISIHVSGVTAPITALVFELGSKMLPFFLLTLPVAWARIELKAHDYKQVTVGALLAAALTWLQMSLYVNLLLA